MADEIIVLERGSIERGSHEQLVAEGGRCARLFTLQARTIASHPNDRRLLLGMLPSPDMKQVVFMLVSLVVGCSHSDTAPAASRGGSASTGTSDTLLIGAVGARPRGFARFAFREPVLRAQLESWEALAIANGGASLAKCGVAVDHLERVRIAIGEPFRIAAEIDGVLDVKAVACVLGSQVMGMLAKAGVTVRDRPGGLGIDRDMDPSGAEQVAATDLISLQCLGDSCLSARLGPRGREIWLEVSYAALLQMRIHGPGFDGAAALASAIDGLRKNPALQSFKSRNDSGALMVEIPTTGPDAFAVQVAAALGLRREVVEAFKIPSSSMTPTLMQGDHVFVAKGALRGPLVQGDLLVYRNAAGNDYVKRLIARGPQTVVETERGLEIDGVPLATEVIDPKFQFDDLDDEAVAHKVGGTLVREHLADRSYVTLHTRQPRVGAWTVPDGQLFFLGDNRENSNDSRSAGTVLGDAVVGRVLVIWYASREGVPDWNRIGTTPE
jgi:signal peptidase I